MRYLVFAPLSVGLLAIVYVLVTPACDLLGKEDECFRLGSLRDPGSDESYHVALRLRVEVTDGESPVQGVGIGFEHWKIHCDGAHGTHRRSQGETSASGLFSTELENTAPTFVIGNHADKVVVDLFAWKDGWEHRERRVFSHGQLENLPLTSNSSGSYRERDLVDAYELVFAPEE